MKAKKETASLRLIDVRAVCDLLSVSRGTLYTLVKTGQFPRPVQITTNRVGWREAEVASWIESRPAVSWVA